jgi:sarcosine oxidase gamma subunit
LNASSNATLTLNASVNAGTGGTTIINWGNITAADPPADPVLLNNSDHDGITVHAAPAAYPASNSPVWQGATIYLFGGPGNMTSYHWEGPGGFTSNQENPTIPNATLAMAGNYTLTIVDSSGCGNASATTNVTVDIATASSSSPVYVGDTIQLFGGPDGMTSYNWTGPDGWTSSAQNATRPNATLAMAGNYTLIVTNGNGYTDDASTDVTVSASGPLYDNAVGWQTYPISKVRVLLPWIALVAVIMAAVSLLVLRRRRA